MENLIRNIGITFEGPGDYGLNNGFFNAIAIVSGKSYDFQCCAESSEIDIETSGYRDGICGDANSELAELVGWQGVELLLERAIRELN